LAGDVLQDAFIKIWCPGGSFDSSRDTAMSWMMSISSGTTRWICCAASVSESVKRRKYNQEEDFPSEIPNRVSAAQMDISARAVMDCLGQLKEPQRHCIMIAYYYGHAHEELSTLMRMRSARLRRK